MESAEARKEGKREGNTAAVPGLGAIFLVLFLVSYFFVGIVLLIQRVKHAVERGFGVAQLVAAEANELGRAFDAHGKVVYVHGIGFQGPKNGFQLFDGFAVGHF